MALHDIEPGTKTLVTWKPRQNSKPVSLSSCLSARLCPVIIGQDLTQEALAKAWRSQHPFTKGSNLKAWPFTILRNEYYSQQRRAWRQSPWDEALVDLVSADSIPRAR